MFSDSALSILGPSDLPHQSIQAHQARARAVVSVVWPWSSPQRVHRHSKRWASPQARSRRKKSASSVRRCLCSTIQRLVHFSSVPSLSFKYPVVVGPCCSRYTSTPTLHETCQIADEMPKASRRCHVLRDPAREHRLRACLGVAGIEKQDGGPVVDVPAITDGRQRSRVAPHAGTLTCSCRWTGSQRAVQKDVSFMQRQSAPANSQRPDSSLVHRVSCSPLTQAGPTHKDVSQQRLHLADP